MRCPECQHEDTRVVDSRTAGDAIRRRRQCSDCGARFTTHERLENRTLWVNKKAGRREPFSRDKVLHGIALACRKRPVDAAGMEAAVRQVESLLIGLRMSEITTAQEGDGIYTRTNGAGLASLEAGATVSVVGRLTGDSSIETSDGVAMAGVVWERCWLGICV